MTIEAQAQAALALGVSGARVTDAWYEPECSGVSVYFLTESGPVWSWYDPTSLGITHHVNGDDVLSAINQHLGIDMSGMTWTSHDHGTGGRPSYLIGFERSGSGQPVYLRLKTESCGLQSAELVRLTKKGIVPLQDLALQPTQQLDYRNLQISEPEVERRSEKATEAYKAVEEFTGLKTNYYRDAWVEPGCNAAVVVQVDLEGTGTWFWYDFGTRSIQDILTRDEIIQAIQENFSAASVRDRMWTARFDTPGGRPRYFVAFLRNSPEDLWLHLDTRQCSLRSAQVQLVRDLTQMGRFVSVDIAAIEP